MSNETNLPIVSASFDRRGLFRIGGLTVAGAALIAALSATPHIDLPLIGTVKPWQFVFILLALPDLFLGVLTLTAVKEPVRRGVAHGGAAQAAPPLRLVTGDLPPMAMPGEPGQRGVLLMQSSGVGNCINMLSLATLHRTPMPMLVTMRGDFGEFNPAQVPMGQATQPVLEAMLRAGLTAVQELPR